MFYRIEKDCIEETNMENWEQGQAGVALFTQKEWEKEMDIRATYLLNQRQDNIHFCKLEIHLNYLFGTVHIPVKKEHDKNLGFAFYLMKGKLIFIDDTGLVQANIKKILAQKQRKGYALEIFFYDFMVSLIDEDLIYLASLEREITIMEESMVEDEIKDFNYRMLQLKKEVSRLYRYYCQLADLGGNLFENEMEFLEKKNARIFRTFTDRALRLQEETQVLREYAMQVQDVYQSEIGIRQNNVMKILTIVTTVFLPLTLIAGWYGMNFTYMPELQWVYGYPVAIGASILVVVTSLLIFKKKKFL
ncbi:MAG: cobalt transporter [Lachnospiraceae bacterium]|nr:cobalt transporter [Lachnospiraceae bacterium]